MGCMRTASPTSLLRTPLAGAPSLGLNESQSRTVGEPRRTLPSVLAALVRRRCRRPSPPLGAVELEDFLRAINRAEPGLIRVDADETTYSSTSSSASSSSRS